MPTKLVPGKDFTGIGVHGFVLNKEGKLLLFKSQSLAKKDVIFHDVWSRPGGTVEYGEKLEETLIREIKEETNLDISNLEFITYNEDIFGGEHWIGMQFKALALNEKELKNLEPEKHSDLSWFKLNELPDNISPSTKKILKILKIKNE